MCKSLITSDIEFGVLAVVCSYKLASRFPLRSGVPRVNWYLERQGWQRQRCGAVARAAGQRRARVGSSR